jgi:chemotaxis protein methyltransferase CheR
MIMETSNLMRITEHEFSQMRDLIYDKFGISLSDEKRSLLVGRLQKLLKDEGIASFGEYYNILSRGTSVQAYSKLIDCVSTNHTYFNREKQHFEFFEQKAFPEILKMLNTRGSKDLRLWCAGCSSGEEPYMLLMLMHDVLGTAYVSYDGGILATDISEKILNTARKGIYDAERIAALPEIKRKKYFVKIGNEQYQVHEKVREEAVFRRFNLMNTIFPFKKQFQIIFCRNVMIYFDQQTREKLVERFHRSLVPGGYFFIGHSETLGRGQTLFDYIMPAVYRRKM